MHKIVSAATLSLLLFSPGFGARIAPAHLRAPEHARAAQVPAAARAEAAWETYTFDGEEFSVMLPEMPALDHTGRHIDGVVDREETARSYGAYGDGVVYLIRAYDRPRKSEDLNYFAKDYVRSLIYGGRSIEVKVGRELLLGKFSGRQYVFARDSDPAGVPGSSLYVFLTARHAYALRAVGGDDKHPGVQRFINSFTLADKPAGRQIVDESVLPQPPLALAGRADARTAEKETPPDVDPKSKKAVARAGGGEADAGALAGGGSGAAQDGERANAAPGASAARRIYKPGDVTRKVLLVHKPEPLYTETARRNEVTGTVRLRLVLSADGKVSDVVAIKTLSGGLTERAVLAARHIKFLPALLEGRPVSQYVVIEYNFNIY